MGWAIFIWAVVVSGACFVAVGLLVGEALRRTGPDESPGKMLAGLILFPGLRWVEDGSPAAMIAVSWVTWFVAGAEVVGLVAMMK